VRQVLGWFGADRAMFGSDWPVCLVAAPYGRVLEALRPALAGLSDADQEAVLGGSAVRLYRLGLED